MKKTGFIYHPVYLQHATEPHPENPGRVEAIVRRLQASPIHSQLIHMEPRQAEEEEIALIHDPAYIQQVEASCAGGVHSLDMDTRVSPGSYAAALASAGAGLTAIDKVVSGECDNAFCCVRPPGHHAEHSYSMGFCIFNNVAIAARYAQRKKGLNRVFIFDWDVHHGNGTQNAFYEDPTVYYSSAHQYPFYPGTGAANETGTGDGLGATLNFPLRAYTDGAAYIALVKDRLIPEILHYKPDLIIISAGFDAHQDDPLGSMRLTAGCYGEMTALLRRAAEEVCGGRLISMLEGGYNYTALSESVHNHLDNLLA